LRDGGGLDSSHGSEDGEDWVDGSENHLGGRINRQAITWMFEERESKLMPSWELGRIHPLMQGVWFCGDKITNSDMCACRVWGARGILQWGYPVNSGVFEFGEKLEF